MDETFLLADEVAQLLALPRARVARLAWQGEIPCVILPGGEIRFRPSEIEDWLESLARRPSATTARSTCHAT